MKKSYEEENKYFILFSNIIPVKGAVRSLLCDLQLAQYHYIPNDLRSILSNEMKTMKLVDLFDLYGEENKDVLNEYLDYLLSQEFGILEDTNEQFLDLSLEWDYPGNITNAIIDLTSDSFKEFNYRSIFKDLSDMNCECIQFRFLDEVPQEELKQLLSHLKDSRIRSIQLVAPYSKEFDDGLKDLLIGNKRITEILVYGHDSVVYKDLAGVNVTYIDNPILSKKDCGQVCRLNFAINIPHFSESQKFNSCLNRKISIDEKGEIKNCPSQETGFGNIQNKNLKEVVLDRAFQSLWKISKDDIEICKDCEFRYICTDCRVFIQDKSNMNSKPLKCTYDPYTATWN